MPVIETRFFDSDYYSIETREQFLTYISNRIQSRFFGVYEVAIALNEANIEIIRSFTETCIRELNTFLVNSGRTSYPYLLNFTIRVENNSLHFQFPESPPLTNLCRETPMPNTTLPIHHFITPPQHTHSSTSWGSLPEALLPRTHSEEYYQAYAAAVPQHSHTPNQSRVLEDWDSVTASLMDRASVGSSVGCSLASSLGSRSHARETISSSPMYQPTEELRIVQRSQAGIGVKAMLATQVLQQKWECINLRNHDEWRDVPIVSEGV